MANAKVNLKSWPGPAPGFTLPDMHGASRPLAANADGITLVHFFATWCEACRDELPALQRFRKRAGAAVQIIVISVAEPQLRVRRFFEDRETGFPVLLDAERKVARGWDVSTLPTTIILDRRLQPRLATQTSIAWDDIDPGELISSTESKPDMN